jgi:hypothetical protein
MCKKKSGRKLYESENVCELATNVEILPDSSSHFTVRSLTLPSVFMCTEMYVDDSMRLRVSRSTVGALKSVLEGVVQAL